MAVTGNLVALITRYLWLEQECENVAFYQPDGAAFATANMAAVAEAYWNDVKTLYRAVMPNDLSYGRFISVVGIEYNGLDGMGEYAVPDAEAVGTRAAGGSEPVSGTLAAGVRLTVDSRLTRPGQKRIPMLMESDLERNFLAAAFITVFTPLVAIWDTDRALGVPVATGVLHPCVAGKDEDPPHDYTRIQLVRGHVINPYVTSQVSRKRGHGS